VRRVTGFNIERFKLIDKIFLFCRKFFIKIALSSQQGKAMGRGRNILF